MRLAHDAGARKLRQVPSVVTDRKFPFACADVPPSPIILFDKCDSKHPKCTACATAGVPCQQEDRHRQTLTLRGHTEYIERQLALCDALLKRHIPGFALTNIEDISAREGVEIDGGQPTTRLSEQPVVRSTPHRRTSPHLVLFPPPMVPPGYPHPLPMYSPYAHIPMGPPGTYGPHMHPGFPPIPPHQIPPPSNPPPPVASQELKGQDPQSLDMSDTRAIAKSFGVNPLIVSESQLANANDKEDLAVGSGGLTSGRDQGINEASLPHDPTKWIRKAITIPVGSPSTVPSTLTFWLPKDRKMVNRIVDVYFTRLNTHRPVFFRTDFEAVLLRYTTTKTVYLILSLGTLSELSHRVSAIEHGAKVPADSPIMAKELLPGEWPEYYEFFERALAVKPHLRVTISSLQALILLQWYLYTERQGRSLWRLVGSLVRLAIELGLHHDPTSQGHTFTDEEAQLRIRLWGIVMVHDRGTSILLGRPLAISPSDSNTPHPSRPVKGQLLESLRSCSSFDGKLPESYKYFFGGTDDWPLEKRQKLVQDITEDQGLTLLKLGFREFSIVTSHNIIVVHNQLIRFPNTAFFVSPIPLHIAAMVILYGHMSHCHDRGRLDGTGHVATSAGGVGSARTSMADIRLSPNWPKGPQRQSSNRWPTKDPVLLQSWTGRRIAREEACLDLHPRYLTAKFICSRSHQCWRIRSTRTPATWGLAYTAPSETMSQNTTPVKSAGSGSSSTSSPERLAEVPAGLFYPFYPENPHVPGVPGESGAANGDGIVETTHICWLPRAAQPNGSNGSYGLSTFAGFIYVGRKSCLRTPRTITGMVLRSGQMS
ncbi:fungal-specific transcription factor domain-containing protein [Pisolithus marmoratus]|nr:fungal-specific transcription factor domain-containing protein [Pisolithus marmoratus]